MERDPPVRLGDLVIFAKDPQPGEYGTVIELEDDGAIVLWPWGPVKCSYHAFEGELWGQLRVVSDAN